jgi:hypothetical protein
MLNEDDSRENIVKLVSFGLEQWNQRDIVTQEPPKKKKKSEENSNIAKMSSRGRSIFLAITSKSSLLQALIDFPS